MSVTFSAQGLMSGVDADGEWEPNPLTVNMSNRNATLVCEALGLNPNPDCGWLGSMEPLEFQGCVLIALAVAPADEGMPSYRGEYPHFGSVIEGARPEGYLQARLEDLHRLAEWAVVHDATVTWG